jgi:hypothetical protein
MGLRRRAAEGASAADLPERLAIAPFAAPDGSLAILAVALVAAAEA